MLSLKYKHNISDINTCRQNDIQLKLKRSLIYEKFLRITNEFGSQISMMTEQCFTINYL